MPIIWRHLLMQYSKVLLLCLLAFIALLLTTRLDEIAQFAALAPRVSTLLQFILFQIPYIVPIALPISGLISAFLLMQRLSQEHTITALRSCGMSLSNIITPLLFAAAFLSITNFYVTSEMATHAHLMKRFFKKELKAINPLTLLQDDRLNRLKGIYSYSFAPQRDKEISQDVVLAIKTPQENRLHLFLGKELRCTEECLEGHEVALMTALNSSQEEQFDPFIIENASEAIFPKPDLTPLLKSKVRLPQDDYLPLKLLWVREAELRKSIEQAWSNGESGKEIKKTKRKWMNTYLEFIRRLSIACSVFAFTFLGIAYGTTIERTPSSRRLLTLFGLTALYLTSFFAAKSINSQVLLAFVLYTVPLPILMFFSWRRLHLLGKGRTS